MAFTFAATPISEQPREPGQAARQRLRAYLVADQARNDEQVERAPLAVADGVQPGGQAASGSADQAARAGHDPLESVGSPSGLISEPH